MEALEKRVSGWSPAHALDMTKAAFFGLNFVCKLHQGAVDEVSIRAAGEVEVEVGMSGVGQANVDEGGGSPDLPIGTFQSTFQQSEPRRSHQTGKAG